MYGSRKILDYAYATQQQGRLECLMMTVDEAIRSSFMKTTPALSNVDLLSSYSKIFNSVENNSLLERTVDVDEPLTVMITELQGISESLSDLDAFVSISAELQYNGTRLNDHQVTTQKYLVSSTITVNELITFDNIYNLPRETQLVLRVYSSASQIFSAKCPLFNYRNRLISDSVTVKLESERENDSCCASIGLHLNSKLSSRIVSFETVPCDQLPAKVHESYDSFALDKESKYDPTCDIEQLLTDPNQSYSESEKWAIWRERHNLTSDPRAFIPFLNSIPYQFTKARCIAYQYIDSWLKPSAAHIVELLSYKYSDTRIRYCAVQQLSTLTDTELLLYIIPLLKCIRFEHDIDNPLIRFLLQRALRSNHTIGHEFFWTLFSNIKSTTDPDQGARCAVVLNIYLSLCPEHRECLKNQVLFVDNMEHMHRLVSLSAIQSEAVTLLRMKLLQLASQKPCILPTDGLTEVTGFHVERCSVNMGEENKSIRFALRIETTRTFDLCYIVLTKSKHLPFRVAALQVLKLCQSLFVNELAGPSPIHQCMEVGGGYGIMECLKNFTSLPDIIKQAGGPSFHLKNSKHLLQWLMQNNMNNVEKIGQNLVQSLSEQSIFVYTLGIPTLVTNHWISKRGEVTFLNLTETLPHLKRPDSFPASQQYIGLLKAQSLSNYDMYFDRLARLYVILQRNWDIIACALRLHVQGECKFFSEKAISSFVTRVNSLRPDEAREGLKQLVHSALTKPTTTFPIVLFK